MGINDSKKMDVPYILSAIVDACNSCNFWKSL